MGVLAMGENDVTFLSLFLSVDGVGWFEPNCVRDRDALRKRRHRRACQHYLETFHNFAYIHVWRHILRAGVIFLHFFSNLDVCLETSQRKFWAIDPHISYVAIISQSIADLEKGSLMVTS